MTAAVGGRHAAGQLEIFLIDLKIAMALLDSSERETPRLSTLETSRAVVAARSNEQDAAVWRASRIATRIILERWAGISIRGEDFVIEPGGRPRLARGAPHFSISHSGAAALIAVNVAGPIGVDIEVRQSIRISAERQARLVAAAQRLKSPAPMMAGAHDAHYSAKVLRAWVRLEAVAKASGAGIGRVLTDAGVVGGVGVVSDGVDVSDLAVCDVDVGEGCTGAVATRHLPAVVAVRDFPSDAAAMAVFLAEIR